MFNPVKLVVFILITALACVICIIMRDSVDSLEWPQLFVGWSEVFIFFVTWIGGGITFLWLSNG